ncbi:hypothetical protein Taro_005628, partial [Colocasia esculenta]|nr:hypothetical protein [Colocasia esculenta]
MQNPEIATGSQRVGTRTRQGDVRNATGRSDQAARLRQSASSLSERDGGCYRDKTSERGLSGRRLHRVCAWRLQRKDMFLDCSPELPYIDTRFDFPVVDFKMTVCAGRSRRNGEEDELLVVVPQLLSHQELLDTTPASSKLVPR